MEAMVEPAVEMCVVSAEERARGVGGRAGVGHGRAKSRAGIGRELPGQVRGWDKEVFVLNCLVYLLVRFSVARCGVGSYRGG